VKKLKIITVLLLALTWSIQGIAIAQAPTKMNIEALAYHQPKQYAQILISQTGWKSQEYECLNNIWTKESNWHYWSKSSTSTAFGIWQGITETSRKPDVQIRNGLRYIKHRYGNPCTAWKFWRSHYWY
jgi:hypothetical protein